MDAESAVKAMCCVLASNCAGMRSVRAGSALMRAMRETGQDVRDGCLSKVKFHLLTGKPRPNKWELKYSAAVSCVGFSYKAR